MSHKRAEFDRFMARQSEPVCPLVLRFIGLKVMIRSALMVWDGGRYVPIEIGS